VKPKNTLSFFSFVVYMAVYGSAATARQLTVHHNGSAATARQLTVQHDGSAATARQLTAIVVVVLPVPGSYLLNSVVEFCFSTCIKLYHCFD
jgi:hypothetical protein